MNYSKLILYYLLVQLSIGNVCAQKVNKKTATTVASKRISISQKAFVWQLNSNAVLPANTLYKELVSLNDNEVTITRYYTTVSTRLTDGVEKKNTQVFKIYTPTLQNKQLRLVNDGPDRDENFTLILNQQKDITQIINKRDKRIYLSVENQRAPLSTAQ